MAKSATTIEQQIELLKSRGLAISDHDKAREILLDVGYYRLGFYLFPFEKSYPSLQHRSHEYIEGASFEDAVTSIWFVDQSIVSRDYANGFEQKIYTSDFKRNPVIHRHHQKNPNDRFAPAWKTLEFMTFGEVMKLYEQLTNKEDKILIANKLNIKQVVTFENYMHTIRQVRNACAHGKYIFDLKLPYGIRKGPAANAPKDRYNIIGAISVIKYIMDKISTNRANEMGIQVKQLYENLCLASPNLKARMLDFSKI